jgi:hypothetical protein
MRKLKHGLTKQFRRRKWRLQNHRTSKEKQFKRMKYRQKNHKTLKEGAKKRKNHK